MTTLTKDQIFQIADVLYKAVTDQRVKLDFGSRMRTENREAIERGEKPDNYRMQWLKDARNKCVDLLQEIARDFNLRYPHDACSVMDLIDVLNSTNYQFQAAIKKMERKKD